MLATRTQLNEHPEEGGAQPVSPPRQARAAAAEGRRP